MSHKYQYVKINDRYFCLQQNPAILAWILFFKKDTLCPIFRSYPKKLPHKIVVWLQRKYRIFKTNLITFIVLIRYKFRLRKTESVLTLPIYGQVCKPTHKGYKIFDLRRGVVTKIFDPEISTNSVLGEIERVRKVSKIDIAPSIRRWNIQEHWYEEDYISGSLDASYKPLDSAALLKKFYRDIVPSLERVMFSQPLIAKNLIEYSDGIIEVLEASKLSKQKVDIKEVNKVKNFVSLINEKLNIEGNFPIYLVFTHGDFCPANMLNTKNGIKIIDWEGATYRSALFDFYSYFFYRPVSRKVPVNNLISEVNEALSFFLSRLALKNPDIFENMLNSKNIYRWLFYIERVYMLVERKETDNNLNTMDYILRYIEAFTHYEEILSDNVERLKIAQFVHQA